MNILFYIVVTFQVCKCLTYAQDEKGWGKNESPKLNEYKLNQLVLVLSIYQIDNSHVEKKLIQVTFTLLRYIVRTNRL